MNLGQGLEKDILQWSSCEMLLVSQKLKIFGKGEDFRLRGTEKLCVVKNQS
jgi:hypothetical protein